MTLDFPRFDESLRYTGRGATASNYLAQALWTFEFSPAVAAARAATTAKPTLAQLRQGADANRQARRNFLATYAQAHPLRAGLPGSLAPARPRGPALDPGPWWPLSRPSRNRPGGRGVFLWP